MKIYNSLTRQLEDFSPLKKGKAGMYTCGMTVYDYAHIGHGRKYVLDDTLRRVLTYFGYEVNHVQNVTDVGHLVSDEDEGEDKMEKGAAKMKKSVWEVAQYFMDDFYQSMDALNILRPTTVARATDNISEQIELVKVLLEKGFAYETPEAVYFDISRFPRYEGLFGLQSENRRVAVREDIKTGEHKQHPADFALWFKAVGRFANHQMQWDSPWGKGFPGWHIECSAMAMKYLGETIDIHTGGIEHQMVHHPNEIAQSEGATGRPFSRYWLHSAHLLVDGQKMSKSLGNTYRIPDVTDKGFNPMALRYLYLTAHYRTPLNFTWSSMAAAQSAYDRLRGFVEETRKKGETARTELSAEKAKKMEGFRAKFEEAISHDLGLPAAMAVVWEMLKSNIPDYDKLDALLDWDQVFGLRLSEAQAGIEVPEDIRNLGAEREKLRQAGKFVEADKLRMELEKKGWLISDTPVGPQMKPVKPGS